MKLWLKLWIEPSLDGAIRTSLTAAERGVWYELQLLAKKCDQAGYLTPEAGKPYSRRWLAARLNINFRLLSTTLQKCSALGLINDTERGIYLPHFVGSQSDYPRQKPYRQTKTRVDDPSKYLKGKYGHMVQH